MHKESETIEFKKSAAERKAGDLKWKNQKRALSMKLNV